MKKIIAVVLVLVAGAAFLMVQASNDDQNNSSETQKDKFRFSLDWVPNTNHTGVYVAQANGYYDEENIELEILPNPNANPTDGLLLEDKADAAIGFTEGVTTAAASDSPITSIAAVISTNTSALAVRASDNIDSLAELDGKTFGGFGADFEAAAMKAVIKNDGGKGDFKSAVVSTGPMEALETGNVDFVWIFEGWDGLKAKRDGFDVKLFPVKEHGLPDYYTPNIVATPAKIESNPDLLKRFMRATQKGYQFAIDNPDQAAKILIDNTDKGTFEDEGLVYDSQKYLTDKYAHADKPWGFQKAELWQNYPQFMVRSGAILDTAGKPVASIDNSKLYTNQFVE